MSAETEAEDALLAEFIQVTVGNIRSLKGACAPGIVTYDEWLRRGEIALEVARSRLPAPAKPDPLETHPELF